MYSRLFRPVGIVAATGIALTSLAGCDPSMTQSPAEAAATRAASVQFTDNCARLRQPFIEIRAQRDKVIAGNVAAGVAAGVLAGLVIGPGDDRVRNAVIGGLAGAMAGAARAYSQNAASRGATDASLRDFVRKDARNEAAQNDRLVRTIVEMNACRLRQTDKVYTEARNGRISTDQARLLLNRIKAETREDNKAIQRVSSFGKTYNAYVGVLDARDVAAARQTRQAVANYKPQVRAVQRTSAGGAAISATPPRSAPTNVARAEQSRRLMDSAATENQKTVDAEIQRKLDALKALNRV